MKNVHTREGEDFLPIRLADQPLPRQVVPEMMFQQGTWMPAKPLG
ncbi:unnamed protein product, partial [marine sediment metagenome]